MFTSNSIRIIKKKNTHTRHHYYIFHIHHSVKIPKYGSPQFLSLLFSGLIHSPVFHAVNQICLPDGTRSFRHLINAWVHTYIYVYVCIRIIKVYIAEVRLVQRQLQLRTNSSNLYALRFESILFQYIRDGQLVATRFKLARATFSNLTFYTLNLIQNKNNFL